MIFINLYWKDALSEKLCSQEVAIMPDRGTSNYYMIQIAHNPVRMNLIESLYWWWLALTQTLQYFAIPGWPLKKDGNKIDSDFAFYFFMEILIQIEQIHQHKISMHMIHLHNNYSYNIQLVM